MIVRVNLVLNQNRTVVDRNSRVLLVKSSVVSHSLIVSLLESVKTDMTYCHETNQTLIWVDLTVKLRSTRLLGQT